MNLTTIVSPHGTKAHARFVNDRINGAEFCLKIYDIMHDLSIFYLINEGEFCLKIYETVSHHLLYTL